MSNEFFGKKFCPIDIFKNAGISCSWKTIKVGWDLKCISPAEISKFAMEYIEQHPDIVNQYVAELITGVEERKIDTYLQRFFNTLNMVVPEKNSSEWNKEWVKWRYTIMQNIVNNSSSDQNLLESIETIYADLGYPEDMKEFIYYMPIEEDTAAWPRNESECRKILVKKLESFLKKEQERIHLNAEIDTLPRRVIS